MIYIDENKKILIKYYGSKKSSFPFAFSSTLSFDRPVKLDILHRSSRSQLPQSQELLSAQYHQKMDQSPRGRKKIDSLVHSHNRQHNPRPLPHEISSLLPLFSH